MNDDFISRQAAIRAVCEKECRVLKPCNAECGSIIALRELPSVDVQPVRHGHWIPKFNGKFSGGAYWYDCSECGHTVAGGILSGNKFCKNCGADMRGEQND